MTRGTNKRTDLSVPSSILIVEDNPDGRETLRRLLELEGHEVFVASDGVEGLEKAIAEHPVTAVLDIGLPGLDGYHLAQSLRHEFGSKLILIAYTAYGLKEDRDRAAQAGFDAYYIKPSELDKLLSRLRRVTPGRYTPQ
jgi:DNA-binding response OmpR family regulator